MPAPDEYGLSDPSLAPAAALMADRARAAMLTALLGGRALAAGELARLAGVQPSTPSAHPAPLLGGGRGLGAHPGRDPGPSAGRRPVHGAQPGTPAVLLTSRARGRGGDRGAVPARAGPAGAHAAPVPPGGRAGRRAQLLRPRGGARGRG